MSNAQKPRRTRRILLLLLLLTVAVALCMAYLQTYAPAQEQALAAMASQENVTVSRSHEAIIFQPRDIKAGLIFYPGAKVDSAAYAPLMQALAEQGVLCIVPEMPYHLAIFEKDAADRYQALYPEVVRWAVGGHSLGGAMAADYVADHAEEYDALVLLAAYSTKELPEQGLSVVSVVGTEDGVLNWEKYETYQANLPQTATMTVLEGGNHAQFADYGKQNGDGEATLSAQEQVTMTVEAILPTLLGAME